MLRLLAASTLFGVLLLAASPGGAAPLMKAAGAKAAPATDLSAQSRRRPRTRIRVTPLYPYRTFNTAYPLPYEYEYPGPGATRECRARLQQEWRPSGTVIVPRMNCWWVRG